MSGVPAPTSKPKPAALPRERWCSVCHTRHDDGPICPGELVATSTERYGWKATVQTAARQEIWTVLIAPCGSNWRARIMTLPRMLWCVPGQRASMKFVAQSAQLAEERAREYIKKICRVKQFKYSESVEKAEAGRAPAESGDRTGPDSRILHAIDVRFGLEKADQTGKTTDLSVGGMFISTRTPLPKGRRIKLVVEMPACSIPLRARVVWARPGAEQGRPAGMGVQIYAPPAMYLHYVRDLGGSSSTQVPSGEVTEREDRARGDAGATSAEDGATGRN